MKDQKLFQDWMILKSHLHNTGRTPHIKEREIWWCAIGENVGVEINGKNKVFSRPILIFKKFSTFGFFGIPLTSQPHSGSWYVEIIFQNNSSIAVLSQARTISVSRLYDKMGEISEADFKKNTRKF